MKEMRGELGESNFIRLVGGSPIAKALEFMLTGREFDYSKREIAENSGVSYNTLNTVWRQLIEDGILVKTRRIGKQDMFRLNMENENVKKLVKFFDSLIRSSVEEHGAIETVANNRTVSRNSAVMAREKRNSR